jgi:hypothetical protein
MSSQVLTITVPQGARRVTISFDLDGSNEIQQVNVPAIIEQDQDIGIDIHQPQQMIEESDDEEDEEFMDVNNFQVPEPEAAAQQNANRLFNNAQPGSFLFNIDMLISSGKTRSAHFSRREVLDLLTLKRTNSRTYKRVINMMNLPDNERKNLRSKVWRLEKPELVRANNRRRADRLAILAARNIVRL